MMTRQERALRNTVILLAAATLMLGGLLFWSLRAMAILKGETAEGEASDIAAAGGQPVTDQEWIGELKKKHGDEVLLSMLNHIVVGKEAEELGITVTDEEVEQELKRGITGYGSEEQYYDQMQSELGLSREELREETAYRLTLQAVATSGITVSEAEIDEYLEQNAERFIPGKQMQLSMIKLATYSEGNQVMERLEQGEDFAELARDLSTDEESRQHGGNIGMVEENDPFWPEELLKTAAELEAGDIAGPLQVEDGYAVIRLEKLIAPEIPDQTELRGLIRRELALEQAAPLQQVERDLRAKYDTAINVDNGLQH
ncbi:peptidylprolyl isomerase [Paenibacillus sp. MMS20-IR301]|uniref:peptidylprolyl isomerase n=1 Tax=Paenibacillus sp. MMS20-IR301 TaxID=2895946 RepID=UPI0028E6B020|nr:peptidylprolyl isomerase [Paenibacillus sp. MMS20-IR301]WNS42174.1 peptidylprolyl isomerase [Paenibacillus sp. MMS20-IR301]